MKNKIINSFNQKNYISYLIIIFTAVILLFPFLLGKYTFGHDSSFHVSNIISLRDAILGSNKFFPKILPNIAKNFGYATPLFYGPFPHYITAFISLGLDIIKPISILHVMAMVHIIVLSISGIAMYHLVLKLSKNKFASILAAIIYMTFPYHISEITVRDSFAESFVFMYIPLIFNGIYELLYNNDKRKYYLLFVVGCSLLVITHTISTLYTTLLIILILLINYKRTLKKDVIIPILISGVMIACLTAFFILPLLELKINGNYHVFNEGSMATIKTMQKQAINGWQLLQLKNVQSFDGIQFFILWPVLFSLIYSCYCIFKKKIENKKIYIFLLVISIILMMMATKYFPWKIMPSVLTYIQFPWRMLLYAVVFLSIVTPMGLVCMSQKKQKWIFLILYILILGSGLLSYNYERVYEYIPEGVDMSTFGVGATKEYFPEKVVKNFEYYENRTDEIITLTNDSDTEISEVEKQIPYLKFKVKTNKKTKLEVPLIYYQGYTVNIKGKGEDGHNYLNYYKAKERSNGFIEITVPKGETIVNVDYTGTKLMQISKIISFGSIIIYYIFIVKGSLKYEKSNKVK